jgi:hypothetical protein
MSADVKLLSVVISVTEAIEIINLLHKNLTCLERH